MAVAQYSGLVEVFKRLPDPRHRKGRRHRWPTLLMLITAALASACRTPRAIARWVQEHQEDLLAALPSTVLNLPSEATLRRALASVDLETLEQELRTIQSQAAPPPSHSDPTAPPRGVAIDGKAIRGVGRDGHPCHLVSLVTHTQATVVAQVAVAQKRDERTAVPTLLAVGACAVWSSPSMHCTPNARQRA